MHSISQMLIFSGAVLIVVGILFSGKFGPLGRLPGDIIINKGNATFFFPITTLILVNVIVAIVMWFVGK
jgi:hypothetical protein